MAIILYARRSVERENSISCETQLAYCRSVIKPDEQDGPVTNRQGSAPWRFVAAYSASTWVRFKTQRGFDAVDAAFVTKRRLFRF